MNKNEKSIALLMLDAELNGNDNSVDDIEYECDDYQHNNTHNSDFLLLI